MSWLDWYNSLDKPAWTPAPATIGLIWRILYPIILFSLVFVVTQVVRGKLPRAVLLPFIINLVANLAFMPIQAGLRNLALASVDIVIVWATIVWMMVAVWRSYPWLAALQLPYLTWVSIATVLQFTITVRNA